MEESCKEMFGPPVMLMMADFAPLILASSNGERIALAAASFALFSPCAIPIPMRAVPLPAMTERISAKSRLMNAGTAITSVMV